MRLRLEITFIVLLVMKFTECLEGDKLLIRIRFQNQLSRRSYEIDVSRLFTSVSTHEPKLPVNYGKHTLTSSILCPTEIFPFPSVQITILGP